MLIANDRGLLVPDGIRNDWYFQGGDATALPSWMAGETTGVYTNANYSISSNANTPSQLFIRTDVTGTAQAELKMTRNFDLSMLRSIRMEMEFGLNHPRPKIFEMAIANTARTAGASFGFLNPTAAPAYLATHTAGGSSYVGSRMPDSGPSVGSKRYRAWLQIDCVDKIIYAGSATDQVCDVWEAGEAMTLGLAAPRIRLSNEGTAQNLSIYVQNLRIVTWH